MSFAKPFMITSRTLVWTTRCRQSASRRLGCTGARFDSGTVQRARRNAARRSYQAPRRRTVGAEQIAEAQSIAPIVCVQNFDNIAHRQDDSFIDSLAEQGIAYVPYFPLGGFSPLQSDALSRVADHLEYYPNGRRPGVAAATFT